MVRMIQNDTLVYKVRVWVTCGVILGKEKKTLSVRI